MTILDTKITPFGATLENFSSIILGLAEEGYSPLITQAKQRFLQVFAKADLGFSKKIIIPKSQAAEWERIVIWPKNALKTSQIRSLCPV
jgi:hypothetical protein